MSGAVSLVAWLAMCIQCQSYKMVICICLKQCYVLCGLTEPCTYNLPVLLVYVPHGPCLRSHLSIQDINKPVMSCHWLVNLFLPAWASNPPMPLEWSNALLNLSDPNIILGPCKCHATECVLENGDPLILKKKNAMPTGITVSSASTDKDKSDNYTLSLMPPLLTHLTHAIPGPKQATNYTEGCNNRASDRAEAIVVEDSSDEGTGSNEGATTEEDDDTKLGMCCMVLVGFQPPANWLVNQLNFKRSGMHQYMSFLRPSHKLSILKTVRHTSLNVQQANVKPRNASFVNTWTHAI